MEIFSKMLPSQRDWSKLFRSQFLATISTNLSFSNFFLILQTAGNVYQHIRYEAIWSKVDTDCVKCGMRYLYASHYCIPIDSSSASNNCLSWNEQLFSNCIFVCWRIIPHRWISNRFEITLSGTACVLFHIELFCLFVVVVVRNVGIGTASMIARIGSMVAPFILSLKLVSPVYPAVILGVMPLIGAVLVLLLPETQGFVEWFYLFFFCLIVAKKHFQSFFFSST